MKKTILTTIVASAILLFAGCASSVSNEQSMNTSSQSTDAYTKIPAKQAKDRMDSGDNIIVLDVRTKEEYLQAHIKSAILVPNETITDKKPAELPDINAEILVYCRSGNRSAQAAKKLVAMGYTNVKDFGGINGWTYETVSGEE